MKKANIGDIWLVLIPKVVTNSYKTHIELEKRPCLIIDDGHGFIIEKNKDCLGMKITTKDGINRKKIDNWYELGLREESYIRVEMPIKIENGQLLKKINKMDKFDLYVYLKELSNYFNTDVIEKIKTM